MDLVNSFEAVDDIAPVELVGIAAGGHDHAERGARIPARLEAVQAAIDRRLAQLDEIALQAHEDGLRFGIAQSAIEFQYIRRAVLGNHQARV